MAKDPPEFVTFLLGELSEVGTFTASRFFGGWQVRAQGRQIAIVMKGTLYLKVDSTLQKELERNGSTPFSYAKSGATTQVPKYMSAPDEALDDLDLLRTWVRRVMAA